MIRFLALLMCLLTAASAGAEPGAGAIAVGEIRRCVAADRPATCVPVRLQDVSLSGPEAVLVRNVTVRPDALPLSRPLMVWVIATASSEISWNGTRIGRNGVPGIDAAHERPGRFIATFVVPADLVRPGANLVSVRLSAHHLWLPVRRAVQSFDIGAYESPYLPGLASYLPALLMLGALLGTCLYFAAAAWLDREDRGLRILAAVAALATLQLVAETARSFVSYTYPWHVVRVGTIALLAAATATLVALYAARRFAPAWERRTLLATGAACLACVLLVPWYDLKAIGALVLGMIALLVCAIRGRRAGMSGATAGIAAALLFLLLIGWQLTDFLDRAYYLFMAAAVVALAAEQLLVLRHTRGARDAEEVRAQGLEEKLRRLSVQPAGTVALLKDGGRTHRVAEDDILFARAADDYSEVQLRDGRTLLVTQTLARLQATLSGRFVRIHKSYVVNAAAVATVAPRPGGGRMLRLSDGSMLPVGRSYLEAVAPLEAGRAFSSGGV